MPPREERLTGRRKAAALLITLGKERSAQVLRHLNDEDIERLTWEISAMGELKAVQRREVVGEFQEAAVARNVISLGGFEYADLRARAVGRALRHRCAGGEGERAGEQECDSFHGMAGQGIGPELSRIC